MARRKMLAHTVVFGPLWWVLTLVSTAMAAGTISASLLDSSYSAVDRIGGAGIGLVIGVLAAVLWMQTPRLAPIVVDRNNLFKPWAVKAGLIVLAVSSTSLFVLFLIFEGEAWPFTVGTGILALVFGFAAIFGRTRGHSSLPFGIRHPRPTTTPIDVVP